MRQALLRLSVNHTKLLGVLAAFTMMLIWSGWIVSSRQGLTTSLSPLDITWMRFVVASLVTLPIALSYHWRTFPVRKACFIALSYGAPYAWLAYLGLIITPSANASVIINGGLPVATSLIAVLFFGARVTKGVILLIGFIFLANILTFMDAELFNRRYFIGVSLLAAATVSLAIYMAAVKAWEVSVKDIMVWVPLINTAVMTPIWLIFSNGLTSFTSLPVNELLFHVIYQGVIVSVVALFLFSFAIRAIGAVASSVLMAFVPSVTAVLALVFNNEVPNSLQWLGIACCSIGLAIYSSWDIFRKKIRRPINR